MSDELILCAECEIEIDFDEAYEVNGDYFCEDCYNDLFVICYGCNEVIYRDEANEGANGKLYCNDCWCERFTSCVVCNEILYQEDAYYYDGEGYCPDCFNERFAICDVCGEAVPYDEVLTDDYGTQICEDCFNESYYRCSDCGRIIHSDYTYMNEDDDEIYCRNCYEEHRSRVIHSYNYKPSPIFYGEGSLFLGVELEIDGGGEYQDKAEAILDVGNEDNEYIYIKHDGSLSRGLEIVSHPATLEYHINYIPWKQIMEKAKKLGYTSHDNGNCGLHVHVSRKAFGKNEDEQDTNIMKLLFLVERFWDQMVKFSRRTNSQLDRWAKRYGLAKPEEILERAKGSGRYYAINLENNNTIEIRLFRGTLRYTTFIATLQFVERLVKMAINTPVNEIQELTWEKFIEGVSGELKAYLITRHLKEADQIIPELDERDAEEIRKFVNQLLDASASDLEVA